MQCAFRSWHWIKLENTYFKKIHNIKEPQYITIFVIYLLTYIINVYISHIWPDLFFMAWSHFQIKGYVVIFGFTSKANRFENLSKRFWCLILRDVMRIKKEVLYITLMRWVRFTVKNEEFLPLKKDRMINVYPWTEWLAWVILVTVKMFVWLCHLILLMKRFSFHGNW